MHIKAITPTRLAVDLECRLAVLPTDEGEVGIEEDHAHMMVTLVPGQMRIYEGGQPHIYAVSGGVADIHPRKLLVLADAVEAASEIDLERARRAKERAENRLEQRSEGMDVDRAQAALSRAINRIRIATGRQEK